MARSPQSDAELGRAAAAALWNAWPDTAGVAELHTSGFAIAAVEQLHLEMSNLAGAARVALDRGAKQAAVLNADPFHGVLELVQNAEDVGATRMRFVLESRGGKHHLLACHDGARVRLRDALAMGMSFLTTKADDPEAKGRFGIGLKTLTRLGAALEVHCPPYHFVIEGNLISSVPPARAVRNVYRPMKDGSRTLFRLQLDDGVDLAHLRRWFRRWDPAELLFLNQVEELVFHDTAAKRKPVTHKLKRTMTSKFSTRIHNIQLSGERVHLDDPDSGRSWVRYTLRYPVPKARRTQRPGKKAGATTPVSIAVPDSPLEGRLFNGLSLNLPCRLPYSVDAQFNPDQSRAGILLSDAWNEWLFSVLGAVAGAAALDLFRIDAKRAWNAVALQGEVHPDTPAELAAPLAQAIGKSGRQVHDRARIKTRGRPELLRTVAYEAPSLEPLLTSDQVEELSGWEEPLPSRARDEARRWRSVMDELDLGSPVSVEDALAMFDWDDEKLRRSPAWFIKVAKAALDEGLADQLARRHCVVLADEARIVPPARGDGALLKSQQKGGLAARLGLAPTIHRSYLAKSHPARAVRRWLESIGALRDRLPPRDALGALAAWPEDEPLLLTRSQLELVRDALQRTRPAERQRELGLEIGQRILVDGYTYEGREKVAQPVKPADAYFPPSLESAAAAERWSTAAGLTEEIHWISPGLGRLRSGRSKKAIGPQRFLSLLGARSGPRLEPFFADGVSYTWGLTQSQRRRLPEGADRVFDDHESPDLERVIEGLQEAPKHQRQRRARALLATLNRGWRGTYSTHARVEVGTVARRGRRTELGEIPASWISRAAEAEWLTDQDGQPSAPMNLSVRTPENEALWGSEYRLFARELRAAHARWPVVAELGIASVPTVTSLIDALDEIRENAAGLSEAEFDREAQLLYGHLLRQVPRGQLGPDTRLDSDWTVRRLRAEFTREPRILAQATWWRRSNVFRGDQIFRGLRGFVPNSGPSNRLWRALGITEPSAEDCVEVLREISNRSRKAPDFDVTGAIYRRLQTQLETASSTLMKRLKTMPLWTGSAWGRPRHVYSSPDESIQGALREAGLAVWEPGYPVSGLLGLAPKLGVQLISEDDLELSDGASDGKEPDLELTSTFWEAIHHLRGDLQRADEALHGSSRLSWRTLSTTNVVLADALAVSLPLAGRRKLTLPRRAFFRTDPPTLFVDSPAAAGEREAAGSALSRIFKRGNPAALALFWETAWRDAEAELSASTIDLPEEPEDRIDQASEGSSGMRHRPRRPRRSAASGKVRRAPQGPAQPPPQTKDPSELVITSTASGGRWKDDAAVRRRPRPKPDPHKAQGKPAKPPRRRPRGVPLSPHENEDVAFELLRDAVWHEFGEEIEDLRHVADLGADARDKSGRYYELKHEARALPSEVRLRASQAALALSEQENFYLAVVFGLTEDSERTGLLLFRNPLKALEKRHVRATATLSGVRDGGEMRRYEFSSRKSARGR